MASIFVGDFDIGASYQSRKKPIAKSVTKSAPEFKLAVEENITVRKLIAPNHPRIHVWRGMKELGLAIKIPEYGGLGLSQTNHGIPVYLFTVDPQRPPCRPTNPSGSHSSSWQAPNKEEVPPHRWKGRSSFLLTEPMSVLTQPRAPEPHQKMAPLDPQQKLQHQWCGG